MTIKVVHAVPRDPAVGSGAANAATVARSQGQGMQAAQVAQSVMHSDAAVMALRSNRHISDSERIKDLKEAKSVAREVADRVKYQGDGMEAHAGLSYVASSGHLAD